MPLSLRLRAFSFLPLFVFITPAFAAKRLRINTNPPGAKVQINGVELGVTPFEKNYPESFFRAPRMATSKRLQQPLVARLTLSGYATKELPLTEGPMQWSSLNGRNHFAYWLFKSDHFDVTFDSISETFTGGVSARLPAGSASLAPELSLEALAALAKPAVVQLQGQQKMGSGFFVTETGVIATNAHVARDEGTLLAMLSDGRQLEAKVAYIDEDLDIALLKVPGENFPHLALASAETVRQGESVLAIGNPGGAMQFSMTKGIVSAVGKFRDAGPGTWVQTDAPINPGNSGGPLVNLRGEVVGVNTLKLIKKNTNGIAFALSASDLLDVLHRFYPATLPLRGPNQEKLSAPLESSRASPKSNSDTLETGSVVFTAPEGAAIYIDDRFVGHIPSTIRLPAGLYRVRVSAKNSADWFQLLEVRPGSSVSIHAELPPLP